MDKEMESEVKLRIKTEFCIFSRKTDGELSNITVKMDGKDIKKQIHQNCLESFWMRN